jgi:RNA polymerase sigma-70 factor (ECF subfamily)
LGTYPSHNREFKQPDRFRVCQSKSQRVGGGENSVEYVGATAQVVRNTADNNRIREDALVSAAQSGSHAAFTELYRLYEPRMTKAIWRMTKNKQDTEDMLQECFLRAFRSLNSFQGKSSFGTWMWRIAINTSLMLLRSREYKQRAFYQPASELCDWPLILDVMDGGPNPEQTFEHCQDISRLREAMRTLKPTLREAVELCIMNESSMREAAGILQISEAALKSRLLRARLLLSKSMDLYGFRRSSIGKQESRR